MIVFHHLASPESRRAYVEEVARAKVVDDIGATVVGGHISGDSVSQEALAASDTLWLEYTRDHTAIY